MTAATSSAPGRSRAGPIAITKTVAPADTISSGYGGTRGTPVLRHPVIIAVPVHSTPSAITRRCPDRPYGARPRDRRTDRPGPGSHRSTPRDDARRVTGRGTPAGRRTCFAHDPSAPRRGRVRRAHRRSRSGDERASTTRPPTHTSDPTVSATTYNCAALTSAPVPGGRPSACPRPSDDGGLDDGHALHPDRRRAPRAIRCARRPASTQHPEAMRRDSSPTSSSDAMVVTAYWLNGSRAIAASPTGRWRRRPQVLQWSRIPGDDPRSRPATAPRLRRDSDGDLLPAAALSHGHHGTVRPPEDRAGVRCHPWAVRHLAHRTRDARGAATDSRRAVVR